MASSQRRRKNKQKRSARPKLENKASTTYDLDDPLSETTQSTRAKVAVAHGRRRSSLSALEKFREQKEPKARPMTAFEKAKLAREQRLQEQKRKAEEEARKREEKRLLAKKNKAAMKAKEHKNKLNKSPLYSATDDDNYLQCSFCHTKIRSKPQTLIEEHIVSHPTMIRQRLWLGDGFNACDIDVISACKITHILNCTREIALPKQISKLLKGFKRLPLVDKNHENILASLKDGLLFVDEALHSSKDNVVFIHCRQGISRSVSLTCSYLMWKEGLSFHSALSDVRSKRHIAFPNDKFTKQLNQFEKILNSSDGAVSVNNSVNNSDNESKTNDDEVKTNSGSSNSKGKNKKKDKNKDKNKRNGKHSRNVSIELEVTDEDALFLDGLGSGYRFKIEKFNMKSYSGACNRYMELQKHKHKQNRGKHNLHMDRVRSNSVDRASIVDKSQLEAMAKMYAENENENANINDNKEIENEDDDDDEENVTNESKLDSNENNNLGNGKNKNVTSNNKSRKSKSPQTRSKQKNAKNVKNIRSVSSRKDKKSNNKDDDNDNDNDNNNNKNDKNKNSSQSVRSKNKNKKKNKKNKYKGGGKYAAPIHAKGSHINAKRRSSLSMVDTPSTPSNRFDFDIKIDSDLLLARTNSVKSNGQRDSQKSIKSNNNNN